MRSYDDVVNEMLALRDATRKYSSEAQAASKEIEALKAELAWWRKTFGPEKTASL